MADRRVSSAKTEPVRRPAADHSMFERLYRDYFTFVLAISQRHGVASRDAPDVAQDVFRLIYGKIDRYDPDRPAASWVYCFARRAAMDDVARHRHKREVLCDEYPADIEIESIEETAVRKETMRIRHERCTWALHRLKPMHRDVLTMYYVQEMSVPRIAKRLQLSPNTVFTRLRRARARLAHFYALRTRSPWPLRSPGGSAPPLQASGDVHSAGAAAA